MFHRVRAAWPLSALLAFALPARAFDLIAFWIKVASIKIIGWDGFVQKFPIFRTKPVSLDLLTLPPGSVHPPGFTDASEAL
jgi:hypothetical protein